MSDLISRQAVMKEFSDFVRASNNSDFAQTPTWNDAVSLVGSMPSAQPEQRWTPISERLPEEKINPNTSDFEEVLCSTTFGDVRAYKFGTPLGWKEPHFWNGPGMMDEYVLAWMPLPKP